MTTTDAGTAPLTKTEWMDFRQLPVAAGGFSQLFFDFLSSFDDVRSFYPYNFRDDSDFTRAFRSVLSLERNRDLLVGPLLRQNTGWKSPPRTMENIQLLRNQTTLAVVTGQQVGLFGGPLYTVFKIITVIKLARTLKRKFPGYDFVPVFWLEGEDHDFTEMNHVGVLTGDGSPVRIEYLHGGEPTEKNLGPVGELEFGPSLEKTHGSLASSLKKTEFSQPVLGALTESYHVGARFLDAFVEWMNHLFGDSGLVFVSLKDPELKRLLASVFERELLESPATSQLIIKQSAVLEEEYHAQIKPRSVNLFMFHKSGRYLIEPREHDFSLRGTRHFISRDEMMETVKKEPGLFSPNVALRPVIQDLLFPTAAYVGGPSEIAYYAQLGPVYAHFGVPQPVLYPRASASIIEERVERLIDKYGLDLASLFEDGESVTRGILQQIAGINIETLFANARSTVSDTLGELKFGLTEIDKTLAGPLETIREKVQTSFDTLKEKAFAAQRKRNETAMRQMERGLESLLPGGSLQERELSILYYLNKYGPDLIKWLTNELEIDQFRHQILTL